MRASTIKTFCCIICLIMASCTERGIPTSAKKSSAITISPAQGWEIYLAGDEIVRLRKPGTEAIVDLSVIRLGPGGAYADFDSFYRQSSHVSLPSAVTGENEVIIDGVTAKRISFEGRRPDTGVPTAGERYLLESGSNGYFFVYLDAGDTIAKNREEARAMIEAIKLPK